MRTQLVQLAPSSQCTRFRDPSSHHTHVAIQAHCARTRASVNVESESGSTRGENPPDTPNGGNCRVHDGQSWHAHVRKGMQASPEGWYWYSTVHNKRTASRATTRYCELRRRQVEGSVPPDIIVGWERRGRYCQLSFVEFGWAR